MRSSNVGSLTRVHLLLLELPDQRVGLADEDEDLTDVDAAAHHVQHEEEVGPVAQLLTLPQPASGGGGGDGGGGGVSGCFCLFSAFLLLHDLRRRGCGEKG